MHQPTTRSPALWARVALATLILTLLAACGVRETGQEPAPTATLPPVSPTRTVVPFEATLQADKATAMAGFFNELATAEASVAQETQPTVIPTITLSAQEATNEALRATNMARVANDIATSEAMPTPEIWPTFIIPTRAPDPGPFGFVQCEPLPIDQVLIENCWVEQINGVRVGVIAGILKTDSDQGALQVQDEVYLTPTRSGRARMVQADGLVLTVRTAGGDFFSFDVAIRQWGAPQPTATPRPLEDYPQGMVACEDPPTTFLPGNCWALLIGDRYYQLRAGAHQAEPLQGYLIMECQSIQPGGPMCERRRYNTPSQVGRVEIIAADGAVLTLRAEDGSFFGFDLQERLWITPPASSSGTITFLADADAPVE